MEQNPFIPLDMLAEEILKYKTPCELFDLSMINVEFRVTVESSPNILRNLSLKHNLPFANNIKDLCIYYKMNIDQLSYFAIKFGDARVVKNLIGNFEFSQDDIRLALMFGNDEIALLLYDTDIMNDNIMFSYAASYGRINVLNELIRRGYTNYNVGLISGSNYPDIIKLMVEHGANNFGNALINAAKDKSSKRLNSLYEAGGDYITVDDLNDALMKAIERNNLKNVRFLVEHGADNVIKAIEQAQSSEIIDYILSLIDPNECLIHSAIYLNYRLVKLCIKDGATVANDALRQVISKYGIENIERYDVPPYRSRNEEDRLLNKIVKYLLSNGADNVEEVLDLAKLNPEISDVTLKIIEEHLK